VPVLSQRAVVFDDGDLLVLNKPSGLPVLPAGGFLEHTLLSQLRTWAPEARPVHRLGRFTSGLLVCARDPVTRFKISNEMRSSGKCRKRYLAIAQRLDELRSGQAIDVFSPIVKRPHRKLEWVWGPSPHGSENQVGSFSAHSKVELVKRFRDKDIVSVQIYTGRPHQIRVHLAQLGSPLVGDVLYLRDQKIDPERLPGEGGYYLHSWSLDQSSFLPKDGLKVDPPSHGLWLEA